MPWPDSMAFFMITHSLMNIKLAGLGLITLFGFGIAGLLLVYYFQDFSSLFKSEWSGSAQVLIGSLVGLLSSGIALLIIESPFFRKQKIFYHQLINQWEWNQPKIIFISFCAGIGEELFFRAGLQPLLGLWVTAILFVFLHGYLNPKDLQISVYGLVMILIIAAFGYLFKIVGILAVIMAHAVFDWVLLTWMTQPKKPPG